ncbi:hypothetical protein Tco_0785044 [Tanacetum coccineum]
MGEERIQATFEEFKKYKDDRVDKRCAEMDACLDAMSIDFDEGLYPHMLTAITGHRWVIGHDLRMSKGLEYGVKQGDAKLDLAAIEAYDAEVNDKKLPIPEKMLHNGSAICDPALPSSPYLYTWRSDGVPVFVPNVAPQGLAILLADAATQTDISDDEASLKLLRSKSLPPFYNLD